MSRTLTKKQRGFVKDYVKTGIGSLAVKKHYDIKDDHSARSLAHENLTKHDIIVAVEKEEKALADRIPDDLLIEKHLALLNKTTSDGNIDVNAVNAGLDKGYKLKGSYAPEKSQALNVNVEARLEDKSGLEALRVEYEEKLKTQLLANSL